MAAVGVGILIISMVLSACATPNQAVPTAQETAIISLEDYRTPTPRAVTSTPVLDFLPALEPPLPTATPVLYSIVKDDTLLGIALRFGVSLDELLAANPDVDPGFLTIGMTLTLPIVGSGDQIIPTATALPLSNSQPQCYPQSAGGYWCILAVQNNQPEPVENSSALISLISTDGDLIESHVAYSPLNLLYPGDEMPLQAYFKGPLPEHFISQASIFSALPAMNSQDRYVDVSVDTLGIEIDQEGDLAEVSGKVTNVDQDRPTRRIWVVAIAYDGQDRIVGVRKLELDIQIQPVESLEFGLTVFSVGSQILHVRLLAEAQP